MLPTVFFNQSLNSTLIEALMVSTSNYEMRGSLFLGIDASFNLKFRIALFSANRKPWLNPAFRSSSPCPALTESRKKTTLFKAFKDALWVTILRIMHASFNHTTCYFNDLSKLKTWPLVLLTDYPVLCGSKF